MAVSQAKDTSGSNTSVGFFLYAAAIYYRYSWILLPCLYAFRDRTAGWRVHDVCARVVFRMRDRFGDLCVKALGSRYGHIGANRISTPEYGCIG